MTVLVVAAAAHSVAAQSARRLSLSRGFVTEVRYYSDWERKRLTGRAAHLLAWIPLLEPNCLVPRPLALVEMVLEVHFGPRFLSIYEHMLTCQIDENTGLVRNDACAGRGSRLRELIHIVYSG